MRDERLISRALSSEHQRSAALSSEHHLSRSQLRASEISPSHLPPYSTYVTIRQHPCSMHTAVCILGAHACHLLGAHACHLLVGARMETHVIARRIHTRGHFLARPLFLSCLRELHRDSEGRQKEETERKTERERESREREQRESRESRESRERELYIQDLLYG